MHPAVFLDRDNTIIQPAKAGQFEAAGEPDVQLLKGVSPAIASLCGLGYRVVMMTPIDDLDQAAHELICKRVSSGTNGARIDAIFPCLQNKPTDSAKQIESIADEMQLDLSQSWLIGDTGDDIHAGIAAGCRTILLGTQSLKTKADEPEADYFAPSLVEAVRIIAQMRKPEASDSLQPHALKGKRWDKNTVKQLQRAPDPKPDAEDDIESSATNVQKTARRPFRPVGAPSPEDELEPLAPKLRAKAKAATSSDDPASASTEPMISSSTASTTSSTPSPKHEPKHEADPAINDENQRILKQILQELRSQRGVADQSSYGAIAAILLQLVAFVCLLGGLWMAVDNTDLFFRWALAALMAQLATIAALLWGR